MTEFKSFNNVVLDMLEYLRLTQPSLDIKPNSVARDLFIDGQALQIASLYDALREISSVQSIANVTGQDLINYGSNYGISKRTGTKSIGTVVLTFRSMDNDVSIPAESVVRTRGGIPFFTVSNVTALSSQSNALRATAARLRNELDIAGITDEFAIEVSVEAQSTGSAGNISKYSIVSHSISSVNSVTNLISFTGGTDLESDSSFRARILATFAGANVGTALGYKSAILNLADTIDVLVIEPGDTLMTRDGTVVVEDEDGNKTISEAGTGGRIDIYVMGENPQSGTDSFVYKDQSGQDDPTSSDNDYVMGQSSLTADTNLTLNSRRVATLAGTSEIPDQPVSSIVSVSGSSSGPNFVEQYTDSVGNLKGNYTLTKDTGIAGGSAFGLDKFSWTSDRIELEEESTTKGTFNGIDSLSFIDVLEIPGIRQDTQITNENSTISSSRNYITTLHKPVRTVSRVYNSTTGERYVIVDQTPDDTGDINSTGRVQISGRTLPTASDILQVDYIWIHEFDPSIDYDNLDSRDPLNSAQDSVEWGFSNYIRDELSTTILDSYNNLTIETQFFVSRIINVNSFTTETATVQVNNNRKTIEVSDVVLNIHSITDNTLTGGPEVYKTLTADGAFSNKLVALPSDTLARSGDQVTIIYNLDNLYNVEGYNSGTVLNNKITLNPYTIVPSGTQVLVNYVANFLNVLPLTDIIELPISTDGFNSFDSGIDGYQPVQNLYSGSTIISNQRRSPSNLRVTTSGIPAQGTIRIIGTTLNRVTGIFTATADDTINLSAAIRTAKGLTTSATIPTGIYIARVISIEKVTLVATGDVQTVNLEYDITNYGIQNSKWDRANAIELTTLDRTEIMLSDSTVNLSSPITTGINLRVVFYYAEENDYEDLFFSKNGTFITDKRFGHISSINRAFGMQDSGGTISGKLLIDTFNQPLTNSTYLVDYDYTAPKDNERITINFEYNKLIVDATEEVEEKRPITADVLVKGAEKIELDVEAYIIISSAYTDRESTVRQDVADNITATLSADALGTTLDSSDIIDNAYNVEGVDRIRIIKFNKTNVSGTKLSITAEKSQYLAPGSVTVTIEER
jgi:uncharacterized phage protein gp47/JayE